VSGSYRYFTTDALTGSMVASALPFKDVSYGPDLNGPGAFSGTLAPRLIAEDPGMLDPGNRCLFVERNGRIMWGGLAWTATPQGPSYAVEGAGWSSYPQKRFDVTGNLNARAPYVNADPCKVIRDIWAYAQEQPDGNLGVVVDPTTSTATVGTPAEPLAFNVWDVPNLGEQIDNLVSGDDHPDYTDQSDWGTDGLPTRRVRLGYPRLGRRRTDIVFMTGINVVSSPPIAYSGDDYAQVVIATGTGEGRDMARSVSAVRNGRLRLESVLQLPDIPSGATLTARANAERLWRQQMGTIDTLTIRDTPAAPVGSWDVGDDVRVVIHDQWTDLDAWMRITGYQVRPQGDGNLELVDVALAPAGSFNYGSAT
jgi:hypothetical protein